MIMMQLYRTLTFQKMWVTEMYFIESPLKLMKNVFYFILKALLVLNKFKFLL